MRKIITPLFISLASLIAAPFFATQADDWVNFAGISPTTTLQNNHLCYSDGRDIACSDRDFTVLPTGNVGIGTSEPETALNVMGIVTSGAGSTVNGSTLLQGNYLVGGDDFPSTFGVQRSSGHPVIGYAVRPSSVNSGFVSSADNISWPRGALVVGKNLEFLNSGPQSIAVGNSVSMTTRLFVGENGNVGIATSTPATALDISGTIRIADGGETAATAGAGAIKYDSGALYFSDGSIWSEIGAGALALNDLTDVTAPTPILGDTLQWNGSAWNAVSASSVISGSQVAFSVRRYGSNQTVTANTQTDIDWTSEEIDTNDNFDLTTDVFTPTVPGKYFFSYTARCSGGSTGCQVRLLKNGNIIDTPYAGGSETGVTGGTILSMNGTTDNVKLAVFNHAGNMLDAARSSFSGALINAFGNDGPSAADNLGNHTATQNIQLGTNYLSGDGDDEGIYVDNTGNVGIGTNTPQVALDVSGQVIVNGGRRLYKVGSTNVDYISTGNQFGFYLQDYASYPLFIDGNSTVGIGGITAPTTALHVAGTLRIADGGETAAAAGAGAIKYDSGTLFFSDGSTWEALAAASGDDDGDWTINGTDVYRATGNVGIGIADPLRALHIQDSVATDVEVLRLSSSGGSGAIKGKTYLGFHHWQSLTHQAVTNHASARIGVEERNTSSYDASLVFQTRNSNSDVIPTTRMTISENGNVGIGTTSPNAALDVSGDITLSNSGAKLSGTSGTNGMHFIQLQTPDGDINLSSVGDVTVNIDSDNNHTAHGFYIHKDATDETGGILFAVRESGNVGIGTISPAYKLQVAGAVAGSSAYVNTSDERLKTNIQNIAYGLETINALRPVTFNWTDQTEYWQQGRKIGLIAQEVDDILPEVVSTADDASQTKSLAYGDMVPVLIKAIQELTTQNQALQERLEALEAHLE